MKVKVLGTRGEIDSSAPYHSHHSGVLIDDMILLDCGDKEFLKYNPHHILITHLHPDHAYFVREPTKEQPIDIPIYAPESFSGTVPIKILSEKKRFNHHEVVPIPTHHSHKVASQAYLIKKDKEEILYTGDMIWINKQYHELFKNLKLVITEGSYIRKGGLIQQHKDSKKLYGHTGIPNLIKFFSPFTKHILFIHFGSWFYENIHESRRKLNELAKAYNITIHVGYDGMTIDTNELQI